MNITFGSYDREDHEMAPRNNCYPFARIINSDFYDNGKNSRAFLAKLLWSICGQTHEFEIRATRQRARAGNSTICYRKKQNDVSF